MVSYTDELERAWNKLIEWYQGGKFEPRSEEDIQCFLYFGLVQQLGTARGVRPKHTTDKPEKLEFQGGKLVVGNMHFPDLLLGPPDGAPEVAVEIKYKRRTRGSIFAGCAADVRKLAARHGGRHQYFLIFDEDPSFVFLDEHDLERLKEAASPTCKILYFPQQLNTSPGKERARRAVATQRAAGADFPARGRSGAKKAMYPAGGDA